MLRHGTAAARGQIEAASAGLLHPGVIPVLGLGIGRGCRESGRPGRQGYPRRRVVRVGVLVPVLSSVVR